MDQKKCLIEFGKRVKNKRKMLGITQEYLANKLGYTNRTSICQIERGLLNIPLTKLLVLCKELKVDIEDLEEFVKNIEV